LLEACIEKFKLIDSETLRILILYLFSPVTVRRGVRELATTIILLAAELPVFTMVTVKFLSSLGRICIIDPYRCISGAPASDTGIFNFKVLI